MRENSNWFSLLRLKIVVLLCLFSLVSACIIPDAQYTAYVSPSSIEGNGTESHPFPNIQQALDSLPFSQVFRAIIFLQEGIYTGQDNTDVSLFGGTTEVTLLSIIGRGDVIVSANSSSQWTFWQVPMIDICNVQLENATINAETLLSLTLTDMSFNNITSSWPVIKTENSNRGTTIRNVTFCGNQASQLLKCQGYGPVYLIDTVMESNVGSLIMLGSASLFIENGIIIDNHGPPNRTAISSDDSIYILDTFVVDNTAFNVVAGASISVVDSYFSCNSVWDVQNQTLVTWLSPFTSPTIAPLGNIINAKCPIRQCTWPSHGPVLGNCDMCDGNHYAPAANSTTCLPCPSRTQIFPKLPNVCQPCPMGTHYDSFTLCVPCPMGTYQNQEKQDRCIPCERGWYASTNGSTDCTKCSIWTFTSGAGSISCDEFSAFFFAIVCILFPMFILGIVIAYCARGFWRFRSNNFETDPLVWKKAPRARPKKRTLDSASSEEEGRFIPEHLDTSKFIRAGSMGINASYSTI